MFQSLIGILVGFNLFIPSSIYHILPVSIPNRDFSWFQLNHKPNDLNWIKEVSIPNRDFSWFQLFFNDSKSSLSTLFQSLIGILVGFNKSKEEELNDKEEGFNP